MSRSCLPMRQAFSTMRHEQLAFLVACPLPSRRRPAARRERPTNRSRARERRLVRQALDLVVGLHRFECADRRETDRPRQTRRRRRAQRRSAPAWCRGRSAARSRGPCRPSPATSRCAALENCCRSSPPFPLVAVRSRLSRLVARVRPFQAAPGCETLGQTQTIILISRSVKDLQGRKPGPRECRQGASDCRKKRLRPESTLPSSGLIGRGRCANRSME